MIYIPVYLLGPLKLGSKDFPNTSSLSLFAT